MLCAGDKNLPPSAYCEISLPRQEKEKQRAGERVGGNLLASGSYKSIAGFPETAAAATDCRVRQHEPPSSPF